MPHRNAFDVPPRVTLIEDEVVLAGELVNAAYTLAAARALRDRLDAVLSRALSPEPTAQADGSEISSRRERGI